MKVEQLYNRFAPFYDPFRTLWRKLAAEGMEDFLERELLPRYLPQEGIILDLGSGTGANLKRLDRLRLGFKGYVGVDLSQGMIAQARKKSRGREGVSFLRADINRLPLRDGTFDLVISTWVFSHLKKPQRVVEEGLRVLKEGGYLILLFWKRASFPFNVLAWPFELLFKFKGVRKEAWEEFGERKMIKEFKAGVLIMLEKGDSKHKNK
ncbi:MAG: class I SAM-dependent methyltransferase [Nitrospirae bacterium]|nr:class I SAM-dependent methyltransferase [Nitrospirota bacterium]